ncbi:MAG: protein translocase subunit SecD, partial [Candidatus Aureabacteria bacterium]|nr:protein translocase subunit SecD [Candidatus Auribacterota bacterium]
MLKDIRTRLLLVLIITGYMAYISFPLSKLKLGLDLRGGVHIEACVDMEEVEKKTEGKLTEHQKNEYLEQATIVVRQRINQSGVEEAEIRKGGNDRIILQIPGYTDIESAEKLLTQVGYLEFALVSEDRGKLSLAEQGKKIGGYRLLYQKSGRGGEAISQPYLVKEKPEFDGTYLESSVVSFGQMNDPQVGLSFNSKGAKLFATVTRKNIGRQLAIILDDKVVSAPVIQTEIPSGQAVITGKFTLDEAKQLSTILNAGALPAKIEVVQKQLVSATLGKDSIERGLKSSILGLILTGIFMISYYLKSGMIAVIGLLCNAVYVLGCMISANATMTLPGIAGLVLSLAMAVDANVLIAERMREELALGKRVKSLIVAGYTKAFTAILDSNVTTLIASIILFYVGSGPVKGFGLTLTLGIITSLFSSVYVTRVFFDLFSETAFLNNLKMMSLIPLTNFKFTSLRKKGYLISGCLILVSFIVFFGKGNTKYGLDFTGGSVLELRFDNPVKIDEVRSVLKDYQLSIQYIGEGNTNLLLRGKSGLSSTIKETMKQNKY